jgi:hypothetical protein
MSGAHDRLPPTQRRLQDVDEALVAAERALGYCRPAIGPRPIEAERLIGVAVERLMVARAELRELFDRRVTSDGLYGERPHG